MAGSYTNFMDAIKAFWVAYPVGRDYLDSFESHRTWMYNAALDGHWQDAFGFAGMAMNDLESVHLYCYDLEKAKVQDNHFLSSIYFAWKEGGEPPEYDLTLDAILTAMITATPDQIMSFVGIVDAFRQSIWDKPFNREYYAALARGFMEWG